jgi:UDP-N-acetylglucosamine transferase subunit ALG13
LVEFVDQAVETECLRDNIFAQIGSAARKPRNFEYVASLEREAYERCFREASAIISHAGIGTIAMALRHHKPLLVVPREKKYGELVNDHQVETAEAFVNKGHVLMARTFDEVAVKIVQLKSFIPTERRCNVESIVAFVKQYLWSLENCKC